ncbi:MAG: TldD/PmbA family protein [Armatimonadota bacterium]
MSDSALDKGLADRLQRGVELAMHRGAAAAKITFNSGDMTECAFENSKLKSGKVQQTQGFTVEVLVDGRRGTASSNEADALDELIARAITLAGVGSAAHFSAYPASTPVTPVPMFAPDVPATLTLEKLVADGQGMVDRLLDYDANLSVEAGGSCGVFTSLIVTSGGVYHPSQRTRWSLNNWVQRTRDTDILMCGFGRAWCSLNELYDPIHIVERTLHDLRYAEQNVEPPTGRVPVYVEPEAMGMFLWPILMGVNGRNVAKGDSPLKGRLGEQVLDPGVTVVDNPHEPYAFNCAEIDDNGIPTREQPIFRNGILERFLYDLDTAGLAGCEPTGNAGCSAYAPGVLPGEQSKEELLAGIGDGLYIKVLVGFGQSNILNGDFSANVGLGYRIKDGKVVGRVKDTMVAGNVYDIFKADVKLSSERDPMIRMPYAVLEGINVSA